MASKNQGFIDTFNVIMNDRNIGDSTKIGQLTALYNEMNGADPKTDTGEVAVDSLGLYSPTEVALAKEHVAHEELAEARKKTEDAARSYLDKTAAAKRGGEQALAIPTEFLAAERVGNETAAKDSLSNETTGASTTAGANRDITVATSVAPTPKK